MDFTNSESSTIHVINSYDHMEAERATLFYGKSTEDVHTWTSLVRHYLAFMVGSNAQWVAYTVTLLRDAAHEWYTGYPVSFVG